MRFSPRCAAALARRELQLLFETPAAWAALLVFTALCSYLFVFPLFLIGQASIRGLMDFAPLLVVFLAPALTMGLLAEEKRRGTFETLATLPLSEAEIVAGKYLAFAAVYLLCVAALAFYPLALSFLVQPGVGLDWGESLGVLTGLALEGLLLGALGLLCSAMTRSSVTAFLAAFLLGFALFLAGKAAALLPGWAAAAAEALGLDGRLSALSRGVFSARDLLYFLSGTAACLWLCAERLKERDA